MSVSGKEMTFWDHLEELRGTLLRSLSAVFIVMCSGFVLRDFLFEKIILAPASGDFVTYRLFSHSQGISIVNLDIAGQFMVHIRCAMMAGIVIAFPYVLWELWRFVAPALYPREKKGASRAFITGGVLFYIGVTVGYFVLLPLCLSFFQGYTVSDSITNSFSLQSYISMFGSMVLMIGLVFEFPMLIMILSAMGIVNRGLLRKGRRYAVVAVMVLAAFATPADLGSMIIVSVPLYGLYELSILFCKNEEKVSAE